MGGDEVTMQEGNRVLACVVRIVCVCRVRASQQVHLAILARALFVPIGRHMELMEA